MKTLVAPLLALGLACVCGAVAAQTPAINPMPDGSRDLYLGAGAVSAPLYLGARERQVRALPLLQLQWSNGVFVSGLMAGMHLSRQPTVEYGPLVALHSGRDRHGSKAVGSVTDPAAGGRISIQDEFGNLGETGLPRPGTAGLAGMDEIAARPQLGLFANLYLNPTLRVTNSVLYGAGNARDGLAWSIGLQRAALELTAHHRLTLAAGMTLVNRQHNASFFGVTGAESMRSGFAPYAPGGGVRDVSLSAGWNWALSPQWMLASSVRVVRVNGDARHSPLVQRPTSVSVSSGLAYRF
ncbi:MipA/OmpV family protein [Massilia sp. PAMC28688]|uniref:MipA/OmpV family protein n=1 Tax=Massilia sp. PAMC28688 TaxID=2861283 RepID=UPI001C6338F4|nr:MipA/OmpV family protein [Massilia sp. PAMC28688]QYF94037.1 MipA/OmpV family protein [Massilia sp. PAMC28688]